MVIVAGRSTESLAIIYMSVSELFREIWGWAGDNASAIIAVCALVLTIYQARLARRHNRLSVRPLLSSFVEQVSGPDARITFSLVNNGLGPALVDSFEVTEIPFAL